MTNSQFGFKMSIPTNPRAFGSSIDFTGATGITNIAGTSVGKWCTTGNLLAFYKDTSGSLRWVECSVTYFAAGGSQPQGWYFWFAWSGNTNGTYVGITNPTGLAQTLKLLYTGGKWYAYRNSYVFEITGAVAPDSNGMVGSHIMFENGGNTVCSNYSTFGGLDFNNMTYFNSSGGTISFSSSSIGLVTQNLPNNCPSLLPCLNQNQTNLTITRNC